MSLIGVCVSRGGPTPTFLLKDLKVVKLNILKDKHLSVILKSKSGPSIKSIFFNSNNNKVAEYLLNYKKTFNVFVCLRIS